MDSLQGSKRVPLPQVPIMEAKPEKFPDEGLQCQVRVLLLQR